MSLPRLCLLAAVAILPLAIDPQPTRVVPASPDSRVEDPAAHNFTKIDPLWHGSFAVASQRPDPQAAGGFGQSHNVARPVDWRSPGKGLYLLAQPGVAMRQRSRFLPPESPVLIGMRLVLVNRSRATVAFPAADSGLYLIQEARNSRGVWVPLGRFPRVTCGNSLHRVFLEPGYFWEMVAPRYRGRVKTLLRFRLRRSDGADLGL